MSDQFSNYPNTVPAGTTADTASRPAANTVSYTQPTTTYNPSVQAPYSTAPDQYGQSQPQPVFVSYAPGSSYAAQQPKRRLSTPARVLLWICGIAGAATLLFVCAAIWIVGMRAILKPSSDSEQSSKPPAGNYSGGSDSFGGGSGNNGGDSDGYGGDFPFGDDFGSILPYFDGEDGSGSTQQSSSAGLGVRVTEIELEFTIEDKYDAGVVIVSIEENSAFSGTEVRENDLIVEMDGVKITTVDKLKELLGKRQVGDTVELTIARYEKGVASTYRQTVTLIDMNAD